MFGLNPIMKQDLLQPKLWVHSIFRTIQGEGPMAGIPAIFVRLAGCNLKCYWCDTDFDTGTWMTAAEVQAKADELSTGYNIPLLVLTGGEPLRQNILPLIKLSTNRDVQIETAGTLWIKDLESYVQSGRVTIVCSPKTGKVHESINEWCHNWKYIVKEAWATTASGLPDVSTQRKEVSQGICRPPLGARVFVQPVDEQDAERNLQNGLFAAKIAMKNGYTLTLQLHKILGLE